MGAPREFAADRRLEAYFATLRSPLLKQSLRRGMESWRHYAAVTGSVMAMATGAAAATLVADAPGLEPGDPAPNFSGMRRFANTANMPVAGARAAARDTQPASANPTVAPGGIVPIYGSSSTIQPGEWVTIYGSGLANGTYNWNADFPTSLGGTSVSINGKPAYLMYVSPGQINLQAPDDTASGTVPVVITTPAGSVTSTVTLNSYAPSFSLVNVTSGGFGYVAGIILRNNGSGAFGGGKYDILGPTGAFFGYRTVAAQPGDTVELFGVGFGPTTPFVPAGSAFSGAAPVENSITLYINGVSITPSFVGISSAGLYQINITVPSGIGENEVPIELVAGGMTTQSHVLFSLEGSGRGYPGGGTVGGSGGVFSFGSGFTSGWGGTGGGSGGGSGGGGSSAFHRKHKRYTPRLKFPPQ